MLPATFFAVLLAASSPARAPEPILVSAAISLTDALQEVRDAYAAAGGGPVQFNFAGSNVLARQIANGAPVDVFISADEAQMNYAQTSGLGYIMAQAVFASIPIVIVYIVCQKQIGRAMAGTSVR